MSRILVALFLVSALILGARGPAAAQDGTTFVQVEAHPDLATATDRAQAFTALFPETQGFQLRSGWYGIMLGPYPADEAEFRLNSLVGQGLIPPDSFIAFSRDFGTRFWPAGDAQPLIPATDPPAIQPEVQPAIPDETRAEARDSEVLLTEDQRRALQVALQWFGHYQGEIDGAFGPGTRNAMSSWQEAQALEATGILTTRQRADLLAAYETETASFGFNTVSDAKAGITLTLPLGLVEFDHYEPPFVHFRPRKAGDPTIVLISQPGDQLALAGLYDVLQTLETVPLTGERTRDERRFRISGVSDTTSTTVYAETKGGLIKGWMLISTPGNDRRDAQIIKTIEDSFATDPSLALDPGMVVLDQPTRAGLLAGLEVRKPRLSRSGFFIDAGGTVLTTTEAVDACARITLDRTSEARVTLADESSGLAVLSPLTPLAPSTIAEFQLAPERPGIEIAVAGYSYEDRLPAPVLNFGRLEELTGLNGEPGLKRLSIDSLPGDAGGPVLDATGAVIGLLLPSDADASRQLPPGVAFALSAAEIARLLAPTGITPGQASRTTALAPTDLGSIGTGMTVLVSCWD